MVHVSEILIKEMMDHIDEPMSNDELLAYKSKENQNSECCISFKNGLLCIICTTLSIVLVVILMYFYGPTYQQKMHSLHELERLLNYQDPLIENIRLPKDIKPLHYRLRLHPILEDNHLNFTFTGRTSIIIECTNKTDTITLNCEHLNITNIEVTTNESENILLDEIGENDIPPNIKLFAKRQTQKYKFDLNIAKYHISKVIYIEIVKKDYEKDKLIIKLNEYLVKGKKYVLDINYSANISNGEVGFYKSSYYDNIGNQRWFATTYLQPIYARRVFPCFDEPIFKAEFEISIARRTNMTAITNMPLKETEPMRNKPGWVWDHFKTSPKMSTYLVAFTICDFKSINISSNKPGPVSKIWAPTYLLHKSSYAVEITASILNFYENYFQVKYCLPKLDLLILPNFGKSSMGNWGLISFRGSSILLDYSTDSLDRRQRIFNIIAHELAHQWFGNLITMEWWSDLWLNEGFATYMANVAESYLQPQWNNDANFALQVTHEALSSDSLKSSHALHMAVVNRVDIERMFDPIMYNKASCLLRMINNTMGETSFKMGIQEYIRAWLYNSTNEEALWRSLTNYTVNQLPIGTIMSTWTRQNGYPLVTILRNSSSEISIIQTRFGNASNNIGYWFVPINYISKSSENITNLLLDSRSSSFNITTDMEDWIIFNIDQTGFYRVNYDLRNWNLLTNQLLGNHTIFSVATRTQFINDVFELAKLGYLDYNTTFSVLNYLPKHERNYVPWKTTLNSLYFIKNIIMDTEYYGIYQDYISALIKPLNTIQKKFKSAYTNLELLVIETVCSMRDEKCTQLALNTFEDIQQNHSNVTLPYGIRLTVYSTAIEMGGEAEWDSIWNKTRSKNISGNELRILYLSLGCARDPWIIKRYLEKTITGEILARNVMHVWRSISQHPVGRMIGIKFLEQNWKKISKFYKDKFNLLEAIIEEYLNNLSSPIDLQKLTTFYIKHKKELKPVAGLIKVAVDKIKYKILWTEKYMNIVLDQLSSIHD